MTEQFVRIEGTVPASMKDWADLEALKTQTSVRIIVGNAMALYKAENDKSRVSQDTQFTFLAEQKLKNLLVNSRKTSVNWGIYSNKLVNYSQSIGDLLRETTKKKDKKSRDLSKPFRNGVIIDFIDGISHIEHSNKSLYTKCCDIVRKQVNKDDLVIFDELCKGSRVPGDTRYISNTLDDNSDLSKIIEMAHNCMSVPIKHRNEKIQHTMKIISDTFEVDKISEYISVFQNEIEQLEDIKGGNNI